MRWLNVPEDPTGAQVLAGVRALPPSLRRACPACRSPQGAGREADDRRLVKMIYRDMIAVRPPCHRPRILTPLQRDTLATINRFFAINRLAPSLTDLALIVKRLPIDVMRIVGHLESSGYVHLRPRDGGRGVVIEPIDIPPPVRRPARRPVLRSPASPRLSRTEGGSGGAGGISPSAGERLNGGR